MRYCRQCGEEVSENDKFCPKCGARLDGENNFSDDLNRVIHPKVKDEFNVSPKSRAVAAILACPFFIGLGLLGIHLFYIGNTKRGLAYLLLVLLLGWLIIPAIIVFVLALIDFIKILSGDYCDMDGKQIVNW